MIKFCKKYIWYYKKILIIYIALSVFSTIITLAIPILFGNMVDLMIMSKNVNQLVEMGLLVLALGLLNVLLGYWNNRFYITIQTNSAMDMSADVIRHLHRVSFLELAKYDPGYLNESINHDSNSIVIFFLSLIIQALSNGLMLSISLIILCSISVILVLTLLSLISVYVIVYLVFRKKIQEKSRIFKNEQSTFLARY